MTREKFPLHSRLVGIRHDGSVTTQWGGFCSQAKNRVVLLYVFTNPPADIQRAPTPPCRILSFQVGRRERGALPFLNVPLKCSCDYIYPPPCPPCSAVFALASTLCPVLPSLITSLRLPELRSSFPPKGPEITDLPRPETMLCQWSTSHSLGDHTARSTQHEHRFPPIIQLDEVAPPPPPQKTSFSSVPSSSQSYDYWTSSEEYDEVGDVEEEEEEATESYCSSDPSCPRFGTEGSERGSVTASAPVEQKVKMNRVLAWRNSFDSVFAEDNAGMSLIYPFLPLATSPYLSYLIPREFSPDSYVPECCSSSHVLLLLGCFSHVAFYPQRR